MVNNWLLEDGDTASQAESAARPAWQGDKRDRRADLGNGWKILHFTGKGSGRRAAAECNASHIIVATEPLDPRPKQPQCLLFDSKTLRPIGAVALTLTPQGAKIVSVKDRTGNHPWSVLP